MPTNSLHVNIFGSEYVLKADENQEDIVKIAKYVDQKMREIDRSQTVNSNLKIAILAALNIAEELFNDRQYRDRLLDQINEESSKLNRSLQEAIDI